MVEIVFTFNIFYIIIYYADTLTRTKLGVEQDDYIYSNNVLACLKDMQSAVYYISQC